MKRSLSFPALLLGLVPVAGATAQDVGTADAAATATSPDLAEVVDKAIAEYDEAYAAWAKLMRAADEEKRRELFAERPDGEATATRVLGLVKDENGSDAQWRAVSWAMSAVQSSAVMKQARPVVLEHFVNKDELGGLVWNMYGGDEVRTFLQNVAKKTESSAVRGPALFAEAGILTSDLENETDADKAKALETEAIRIYTALTAPEYADIILYRDVKLGATAASSLFELQNLAPGKMAPEIEAEDIDGTSFKLSDYRGKVVMLDFWGDW